MHQLEKIEPKEFLEKQGIKPTYIRIRVLKYLMDNLGLHPAADMVYSELKEEIPTISKTSIYNTLNLFVKNKIVMPITIFEGETRFDLNTMPHHHFLCRVCRRVFDLDLDCEHFKTGFIDGHRVEEIHGYFRGICADCLVKKFRDKKEV